MFPTKAAYPVSHFHHHHPATPFTPSRQEVRRREESSHLVERTVYLAQIFKARELAPNKLFCPHHSKLPNKCRQPNCSLFSTTPTDTHPCI